MRALRHLLSLPGAVARALPRDSLSLIERAITESEKRHGGQIRFAVEAALHPAQLWRGVTARQRAIEVFSQLGVWDTERNNGVLIYLLLADRDVEIVADRGIDAMVGAEGWERICRMMETDFGAGNFAGGALKGIDAVSRLLAAHFPKAGAGKNELPDAPVVM